LRYYKYLKRAFVSALASVGEEEMAKVGLRSGLRKQIHLVGLGFILSGVAAQPGYAASFSDLTGQPNLTALPQLNNAQQTMAGSINNFCPTAVSVAVTPNQKDLATLCSAMIGNALQVQNQSTTLPSFGLDAGGLKSALQQLNGGAELAVPTSQTSVVQTTETSRQTSAIEERLRKLRNQPTGTVPQGADSSQAVQLASLSAEAPGSPSLLAQNQLPAFTYTAGSLGVFASGFGQFGSRDMTSSVNGYSFNNAGFVAGADYRITPKLIAGLAFGYSQSNTGFDTSALSASGQSLSGNLFQGNLYATYSVTDALYLNGIALIGGGDNDSRRHIVIPSVDPALAIDRNATGSFGSQVKGLTLVAGYNMPFGSFLLTPIGRFLYQHTGVNPFNEEGAQGADLQYGSSSVNTYLSVLGADAQYLISTSIGPLFPIVRGRWAHQYGPGNPAVSVGYSNAPSLLSTFILPGDSTDRNYFDLGVGVTLGLSGSNSAFINYDAIVGLSHTSYNSFTAGIRMNF
jgi:outer membrane autotransporter protein